mgnify:CR=1 FL=1
MAKCPKCGTKLPKIKIRKGKRIIIKYSKCPKCGTAPL